MPGPSTEGLGRGGAGLAGSRLAALARRGPAESNTEPSEPEYESCELCSAPIAPEHRHMLDLDSRELMCACRACSTLFDRGSVAGGGHFRLIPDRRLHVRDFEMSDAAWEQLRIPVDMAFFFHNSAAERVMAFYPSPAGPTESQLQLDAWEEIAAANPVLATMEDDVEAILVNRAKEADDHWLVPIEDCYSLVAVIRTRWKGLSGGKEVWEEIASFFEDLDRRSKTVDNSGARQKTDVAASGAARGR